MDEVEETIKRISKHESVEGYVIVNSAGTPIRSNLSTDLKKLYAGLITQLTARTRSVVRDLNPENDLTFLRIRTKIHEILVAPDKDYIFIVIQKTNV